MYQVLVVGTNGSDTADRAVAVAVDRARGWKAASHFVTACTAQGSGIGVVSAAPAKSGVGLTMQQGVAGGTSTSLTG